MLSRLFDHVHCLVGVPLSNDAEARFCPLSPAPLDPLAVATLQGDDRLLIAWLAPEHAVVLAVGPHDRSGLDIYQLLLSAVAVEVPAEERSKPPCCDELGGAR
jgi:hypothetical protein